MRKVKARRPVLPDPDPSIDEVKAYFGVCTATIYNWLAEGRLKSYKAGRLRRVTRESIEAIRGEAS